MTCHDNYESETPATSRPDGSVVTARKFVVGVDGSPAAASALRWAVHQARAARTSVLAVHAFHGPTLLPAARAAHPAPRVALGQQVTAEETLALYVREALADQPEDVQLVTRLCVGGEPKHVLVEQSRGADVLVLGASHRPAFATRVLGSTASTCAAIAACPVLVVPEAWSADRAALAAIG